jgi:hypothetical protein
VAAELSAVSRRGFRDEGLNFFAAWAAVALAGAATVAQILDYEVFDLRIRALNSNTHASVFGGVSLLATAAALAAAVALAVRARDLEQVALVGVLLAILALRVGQPTHVVLVGLPVAATALVILWRQFRASRSWLLLVGCSLLGFSFVIHAMEIGALSSVAAAHDSWTYQLEGVMKHDAELAGWILVAAGLVSVRRTVSDRSPTDRSSAFGAA